MTYTYMSIKITGDMDFIVVLPCTIDGFKICMYFLKTELSFEAGRSEMTVLSYMS
jgi:hypothetical protein